MERPKIVGNLFIKRKNRSGEVETPNSLLRPVSPPPTQVEVKRGNEEGKSALIEHSEPSKTKEDDVSISSAAIEAGKAEIDDHLTFFTTKLASQKKSPAIRPNLPVEKVVDLYQRNQHAGGHHFVIHQHDHPVAGVHYDLRLQISETSSISFAIMYGLPGNPNSKRLNRNATETRVHNLWNHLIETASHQTGSLLIWDTGEYEILDATSKLAPNHDTDSDSDNSTTFSSSREPNTPLTEPEKLHAAFQTRKITLRLHGTKLPPNYTISLRLTKSENRTEQPKKPTRKRRRMAPGSKKQDPIETPPSSDVELEKTSTGEEFSEEVVPSHPKILPLEKQENASTKSSSLEKEIQEQEDEEVRRTNAYPGATNSIGSIHQRKWYLSIDRIASGLYKVGKSPVMWKRKGEGGFEDFFVMGRDVERSVVTGRNADEVMEDEGVKGYVGRKGWRAVVE